MHIVPLEPVPDVLDVLARLSHLPRPVLFDSGADHDDLGRYSFAAADPVAQLEGHASDWLAIRDRIRASRVAAPRPDAMLPPFQGGWAGWFAYELGCAFDRMSVAAGEGTGVPDVALGLYDWVIAWDHRAERAWLISTGIDANSGRDQERARRRARAVLDLLAAPVLGQPTASAGHDVIATDAFGATPRDLARDFTPDAYRQAVGRTIDHVLGGDIFQANLSQRFEAPFTGNPFVLYHALRRRSPAPMGAYVTHGRFVALSVSPERFLRFESDTRRVETRPIKGTRPRGDTPARDDALSAELLTSEKDRAENVMITDLLRNDLARVCEAESIEVVALCRLETHPTVHHLASVVRGTLRHDCDALDLLAATFPGGSVTGAPKIRAMDIIAQLEPVRRGVYCGAIGWIGLDGAMDTSVAIRTITLDGRVATFHVGGGITARSRPDDELQETLDKARALLGALADAS